VSIAVKEQILNSFNSQFEEQNDFLLAQIKKANLVALNNIVETYNHLIQQATAVKEKHRVDLQQFQNHVDKFNKNINLAIDHVGNAFLEVEKIVVTI
jgi:16S rRNA G527 N7-methylase RsmG